MNNKWRNYATKKVFEDFFVSYTLTHEQSLLPSHILVRELREIVEYSFLPRRNRGLATPTQIYALAFTGEVDYREIADYLLLENK